MALILPATIGEAPAVVLVAADPSVGERLAVEAPPAVVPRVVAHQAVVVHPAEAPRAVGPRAALAVGAIAVPVMATATTAISETAEEIRAGPDLALAMAVATMAVGTATTARAAMATEALLLALGALQIAPRDLAKVAVVALRAEEAAEIADVVASLA